MEKIRCDMNTGKTDNICGGGGGRSTPRNRNRQQRMPGHSATVVRKKPARIYPHNANVRESCRNVRPIVSTTTHPTKKLCILLSTDNHNQQQQGIPLQSK